MSDETEWEFPEQFRPKPEALRFDLQAALGSMLMLRAEVPEDAFTAAVLGTERVGNGIVIRSDGLVLTIGYLIAEAETIWLTTNHGTVVPGHALAYDYVTGFGLVLPLGQLSLPFIERATTDDLPPGTEVIVISHGGLAHALNARILARREFAGYWEYVLDEALFTAPAHPHWSGAALLSHDGKLLGVGSLLVQEPIAGQRIDANMFVPVSLLEPILNDMTTLGSARRPTRPWLGMYTTELQGNLVVSGLADGGPADRAGVTLGDIVIDVAGERVDKLAELFRTIWRQGPAGTEVPLTLARGQTHVQVRIQSRDRSDFLKKPQQH
jgi:S1-C subfamily serine protease